MRWSNKEKSEVALWVCVNFLGSCGLENISKYAFYNTGLTNITIPKTVHTIWDNAFGNCKKLETVIFENADDVRYGADMLAGCDNLKTIYVPKGKIDAYKAMLHVDASVKFMEISSTSIDKVKNAASSYSNKLYTIDGKFVKVAHNQNAVYIKNGKKFIMK